MKWKARKKGSVIILTVMVFSMVVLLFMVMINILMIYSGMHKLKFAGDEAARVRAQAINIPLKEQDAIVELYHYPYFEDYGYTKTLTHITQEKGHIAIRDPGDREYVQAVHFADETAKMAGVDSLNAGIVRSKTNTPIIYTDPYGGDVCIDVKPIPLLAQSIHFSCVTENGNMVQGDYIVEGVDKHTYKRFSSNIVSTSAMEKDFIVNSVVFVGMTANVNIFIYNMLANLSPGIKTVSVHSLAYPQVDECTRNNIIISDNLASCLASGQ
jgi:hypothetical protein